MQDQDETMRSVAWDTLWNLIASRIVEREKHSDLKELKPGGSPAQSDLDERNEHVEHKS